jgi:hypothetical protein
MCVLNLQYLVQVTDLQPLAYGLHSTWICQQFELRLPILRKELTFGLVGKAVFQM